MMATGIWAEGVPLPQAIEMIVRKVLSTPDTLKVFMVWFPKFPLHKADTATDSVNVSFVHISVKFIL